VKVFYSSIPPLLLKKLDFYSYLPFSTFPSLDGKDETDGKKACPLAAA
jgi:hypothetical protein